MSVRGDSKASLSSTPTYLHLALGRGRPAVYYNCGFLCLLSRAGESHPEMVGREAWGGNLDITHESVLPPFYFVEFLSSMRWNLFGPGSNFVDLCLFFSLWVRNSLKFVLGRIKFRKVAFIRNLLDMCMITSIVSWFSTWQYRMQRPPITKSNHRVSKDGVQSFILSQTKPRYCSTAKLRICMRNVSSVSFQQ